MSFSSILSHGCVRLHERGGYYALTIELLNKEIRRRTGVVGIFPSEGSYPRLATTYLMEYAEDWHVPRAYLSKESIEATLRIAA